MSEPRTGIWYPTMTACVNGCDLPRYGTHQHDCPKEPHDPPRDLCICAEYGGRGLWLQHRAQCIAAYSPSQVSS